MKTRSQTIIEQQSKSVYQEVVEEEEDETRSQTIIEEEPKPIYEVDIDFDGASEAWHMNKKRIANGCYEYICTMSTKTGRKCCRKPISNLDYCSVHSKRK